LKTILSTKKLNTDLSKLLKNNYKIIEHDFITINSIEHNSDYIENNIIITSKNAIPALEKLNNKHYKIFCVGSETKKILISKGFVVVENASNSNNLAEIIISKHSNIKFSYFCSAIRRDDLPKKMIENSIKFQEIVVYETLFSSIKIDEKFDIIMFFSPSGVKSFLQKNKINNELCFCIGKTTADELKSESKNTKTAQESTIESMILEIMKW
jgi:uroporphyrinogen-III synthase